MSVTFLVLKFFIPFSKLIWDFESKDAHRGVDRQIKTHLRELKCFKQIWVNTEMLNDRITDGFNFILLIIKMTVLLSLSRLGHIF